MLLTRHLWEQVNLSEIIAQFCRYRWYRTLDALLAAKEQIEEALYLRVRDLFSLKVDAEKKTLIGVLTDLEKRFGLNRVMVVGDRGMVSPANLEFLSGTPFRYLLGIPGRRCEEAVAVLDALSDTKWQRVDQGNRVQEVEAGRARQALEKVAAAVEAGRLKDQAKIGARAQRALSQHQGYRYYSWAVGGRGHQRDERVEAHIFVATLALFLKRTLDHQLAGELPELSSTDAFAAMKSIGIAELSLNGQPTRLVSGGGRDARRVLAALGIKDINPPSPEKQRKEPPK
ncbi:MAG: hypothetical protein KAY37_12125 [Phycisphaerae bacterium]|nr:hypothetical protein [Phycisphaerae bacterium]